MVVFGTVVFVYLQLLVVSYSALQPAVLCIWLCVCFCLLFLYKPCVTVCEREKFCYFKRSASYLAQLWLAVSGLFGDQCFPDSRCSWQWDPYGLKMSALTTSGVFMPSEKLPRWAAKATTLCGRWGRSAKRSHKPVAALPGGSPKIWGGAGGGATLSRGGDGKTGACCDEGAELGTCCCGWCSGLQELWTN